MRNLNAITYQGSLLKEKIDCIPLTKEVQDTVKQKFRFEWTYHSCAIEGNSLTIFSNYIDRASNEKRPLSKLTSDLLEQIGIIE